ncbi:MAG TPA: glutamyl-tRNA reductase [Candidatus Polarisedimenticolia bacterium]|jgi:glutamyl-tRNA reductase|nr:glutamyl-tRNA reductase [Candidatus Polarisedimenticolia bacterium]
MAEFLVVGVNHRSGTAALREALYVEEERQPELLARLKAAGVAEAVFLSTCDRSEVQAVTSDIEGVSAAVGAAFAGQAGVPAQEVAAQSYRLTGGEALRHIFAVAASLDSQVIGEPQVLGQVKEAHRLSAAAGLMGGSLDEALQAAYAAAKRVRSETGLAEQPVSIAAVCVGLARQLHGDLKRAQGLLIGPGEMGDLVIEQLRRAGLRGLTVAHPSARRAEAIARRYEAHHVALSELPAALVNADVIVSALGAGRPAITAEMMIQAIKLRRHRPVLLIDLAVPADVESAVDRLEDVFRYELDDLEKAAMQGRSTRAAAASAAWGLIDEAIAGFLGRRAARAAVPTIVALRRHFEALRQEVLAERPADADAATRILVNRLLHGPSSLLRDLAPGAPEQRAAAEKLLARLFDLPADDDEGKGR